MKEKQSFETIPCNICGGKDFRVIYPARRDQEKDKDLAKKFRASGDEPLIDPLVQCKRCGLQFVNPRLKPEIIVQAYSEGEDPVFVSQADARERTFAKSLRSIEKYYPKKGKIYDIGTAGGSFLAAAKKRGWEVYGCEPNKWMVNWGNKRYGLNIKPGTLFDQKNKSSFYDVVTLWDVIEHTPDPSKVLEECNRMLKDNGLLIVNYPDIASLISRLMGRKWLFLTSVHLFYFTPRTIKLLLNKCGFEIVKIRPYIQSLELGYLVYRAGGYSKMISTVGSPIVKSLGFQHKQMPYWLGQTFVIARKKVHKNGKK